VHGLEHGLDVAGQQVGRGAGRTLVGHVHHVQPELGDEHLHAQVVEGSLAGRTVVDRAGMPPDILDELGQRRHAQRRMHAQREVGRPQHGDGREAVDDVERHRGIDQRQRERRVRAERDRMAVGRGLGDGAQADDAGGARLVLDHEGAAGLLGQAGREQAGAEGGQKTPRRPHQ